jgi:SAM-dependent methyltransferase
MPMRLASTCVSTPCIPVPSCPVCGRAGGRPLHHGLADRVMGVAGGAWSPVRCEGCGAARLDPRPADEAIPSLYEGYYTHSPPTPNIVPGTALGRALRALRNDYVNARFGYALEPAWRGGHLAGRLARHLFPPLSAIAERGVRSLRAGERLLDVGCGNGEFVAEAGAAGWDAKGIDLDPSAIAAGRANGLDLRVERIEERAAREPCSYDAVTASHVLEHVPDPVSFLAAARTLLRRGGTVWIATPNLASAGHAKWGKHWGPLDPPRHLVVFDPPSLARALVRAGLGSVRVLPPLPSAQMTFRMSHAVRAGFIPAFEGSRAPIRVRLAAVAADWRAQRDPRCADELVVLARRA